MLIFCKGNIANLNKLVSLFQTYANFSGQIVNCGKSSIYGGAMSLLRLNIVASLSGFKVGISHFVYLGVPIFKCKPQASFLLPIADIILLKLASWKGSLLSFVGRVELVKFLIQSMLFHSMTVYAWPVSLLRYIETTAHNFIWSENISKSKIVTVASKKLCKSYSEGGLGLRSLIELNVTANLKFSWDFLNSENLGLF